MTDSRPDPTAASAAAGAPAVIRPTTPADWRHVREIRLQALSDVPSAFGSTYAREVDRTEAQWRERASNPHRFLAFADGWPVGIAAGIDDAEEPAGTWSLVSMYVAPAQRGTGLATRLIDAVIDRARDAGATKLALWVTDGNVAAKNRYLACGFVPTGEIAPLPSDPSLNEIRMELDLAAVDRVQGQTLTIGIDVGGTTLKAALVDKARPDVVLARAVAPSPTSGPTAGAQILDAAIGLVDDLRTQATALGLAQPSAIGMAVPGIIDEPGGVAVYASAFHWSNEPVRADVERRTGLPVAFGHDVRSAGLGEWRLGAGRGCANVLVVSLGTGIGSALVVDGRLLTGGGYAGQLGHIVLRPGGTPCGCGQSGCVGRYASAGAIHRRYAEASGRALGDIDGSREVAALVEAGDEVASEVWADATADLAEMLVAAITMLGPERVVLAGGPSDSGDLLVNPVRARLAEALTFQQLPEVVVAALGSDAGVLGSALAAADLLDVAAGTEGPAHV